MDSRASGTGALVGVSTGSLARYPNGGDPVVLAGYLSDIEADAVEVLFYRGFHEDLERAARPSAAAAGRSRWSMPRRTWVLPLAAPIRRRSPMDSAAFWRRSGWHSKSAPNW